MRNLTTRIIICLLTIFLLFQNCIFAESFSDIDTKHKNYDAIQYMSSEKIVNGYDDGSFRPDNSVTRAELCVIFARVAGYTKNSGNFKEDLPFEDVFAGYWAEDYIKFAYNNGIVNGMGDGTFLPAGGVTYEQAIKMLVCFLDIKPVKDISYGSEWYSGYLAAADKNDILENVDVNVSEKATRADVVQLIYNAYVNDLINKSRDVESDVNTEVKNDSGDTEKIKVDTDIEGSSDENEIQHKEIKKILIDAGHNYSGYDIGARNEDETIFEEVITWQISDKLVDKLEKYGFEVYITREKQTSNIANTSQTDSLKARVDMAHELDVDLFVSIHCNSGGGTGVEAYCFNKKSVGGIISEIITDSISDATGLYNRGAKTANYYVIRNTAMPSVLVETGFIDSENDSKILVSDSGQNKIAQAIADAIKEYCDEYTSTDNTKKGKKI